MVRQRPLDSASWFRLVSAVGKPALEHKLLNIFKRVFCTFRALSHDQLSHTRRVDDPAATFYDAPVRKDDLFRNTKHLLIGRRVTPLRIRLPDTGCPHLLRPHHDIHKRGLSDSRGSEKHDHMPFCEILLQLQKSLSRVRTHTVHIDAWRQCTHLRKYLSAVLHQIRLRQQYDRCPSALPRDCQIPLELRRVKIFIQ